MSQEKYHQDLDVVIPDPGWRSLYRAAGAGAIIVVGFMLLDIGLSFAGEDVAIGGMTAVDWFAYFQTNWFLGLRNFGFFNVVNTTLTIPLFLALSWIHRKTAPAYAAMALILFLSGAVIYDANNRALSLLALSDQYAALPAALPVAAETDAQRNLLAAAGTVILAQAEDFTPGTFLGFFFNNAATILMMLVILRGKIFRTWIALAGLVGSVCMLFFTISATFIHAIFALAMGVVILGGLLMIVWYLSTAVGMFRMAGSSATSSQAEPVQLATTGKGLSTR